MTLIISYSGCIWIYKANDSIEALLDSIQEKEAASNFNNVSG